MEDSSSVISKVSNSQKELNKALNLGYGSFPLPVGMLSKAIKSICSIMLGVLVNIKILYMQYPYRKKKYSI